MQFLVDALDAGEYAAAERQARQIHARFPDYQPGNILGALAQRLREEHGDIAYAKCARPSDEAVAGGISIGGYPMALVETEPSPRAVRHKCQLAFLMSWNAAERVCPSPTINSSECSRCSYTSRGNDLTFFRSRRAK